MLPGEGRVRLGCGAVAGFVLGIILSLQLGGSFGGVHVMWGIVAAVLCAFFVWKFGDRFWQWITQWW